MTPACCSCTLIIQIEFFDFTSPSAKENLVVFTFKAGQGLQQYSLHQYILAGTLSTAVPEYT